MSQNQEWFGTLRLMSGVPTIYASLVETDKLFNSGFHLFTFGLVYGILHNKKEQNKRTGFVPVATISDNQIKDVLSICYLLLNDGRTTKEIFNEMCEYADGGVTIINQIYKENKSFTLPNLIRDAEELWNKRVKDLQNINLAKS